MRLFQLPEAEVPVALAILKTVALTDGVLEARERQMLEVAAFLYGADPTRVDAIEAVEPEVLAGRIAAPEDRVRLLQACIVMALTDENPTPADDEVLQRIAAALDAEDSAVRMVHLLANGHPILARIQLMRRLRNASFGKLIGVGGMLRMVMFGTPFLKEVPEIAWKYRKLGLLPDGTLGRELWAALRSRGISFPGEVGGLPEPATNHDALHVLTGYDTDPAGEMQILAFSAGMRREDPFVMLFEGICHFHVGAKMVPLAENTRGKFDPVDIVAALERGARTTTDVTDPGWLFLDHVEQSVDTLRETYGILPHDVVKAELERGIAG